MYVCDAVEVEIATCAVSRQSPGALEKGSKKGSNGLKLLFTGVRVNKIVWYNFTSYYYKVRK
jgi:hypothetical protein